LSREWVVDLYSVEKYPNPFSDGGFVDAVRFSNLNFPLLRRGKVRDIYDLGDHLILFHSDRISAFDVVLRELIPMKGIYLNKLTAFWFERTKNIFPNHFVEMVDDRSIKVVKANRIDIEWIVRGYLYGSAWRSYSSGKRVISGVELPNGLSYAEKLPQPILSPTTKSDVGHDVEISKGEAIDRGLVSRDEWYELEEASLKLYSYYNSVAESVGLIIADIKLEFGRFKGELIQIDEAPTHDSARIWVKKYYCVGKPQERYCLDKEFLRAYLMAKGFNGAGAPPQIPMDVIRQVAWRVRGAYEVIALGRCVDELPLKGLEEFI